MHCTVHSAVQCTMQCTVQCSTLCSELICPLHTENSENTWSAVHDKAESMDNGQSSCLEQEDDRRRSMGRITGNCWGDLSIPGNCWGISLFLEALGRSLNFWKLQGRSWKSLLVKKKTFNSRRLLGRSTERVFWCSGSCWGYL